VDTAEKHDTAQGGVLVNSIAQFLHLVKAKIEKTRWEKRYVRFVSGTDMSAVGQQGTLAQRSLSESGAQFLDCPWHHLVNY
jgi:hypothetical protein